MTRVVPWDTAIVGAGLAGTVVAASLAQKAPPEYRAVLFEPRPPGPGTAYAPISDRLLMNGPVRAMSAMPGDAHHLARWCNESAETLIPRNRFGNYLTEMLHGALDRHDGLAVLRTTIVDIERTEFGFALHDSTGVSHRARSVVLAVGNHAPDDAFLPQALRGHGGYVADPWQFDARSLGGREIALIGSGLTAMDAIALLEERGYDGTIHLISRHGLLPAIEDPSATGVDPTCLELDAASPYALLRTLRIAVRKHAALGIDWRRILESIRAMSPTIWQGWSLRERRRFLRHLQSFWVAHRYRVPASTARAFENFSARGRIVRHRGHIVDARPIGNGRLQLSLSSARGSTSLVVSSVVNCTGPNADYERSNSVLIRNLVRRGLIRADALHLGIDATLDLRVIDRNGTVQDDLLTLGPPLRGLLYETTAVPETREQAACIATTLVTARALPAKLGAVS